jgi:hypothetical protein
VKNELQAKLHGIQSALDELQSERDRGMIDPGQYFRLKTEYETQRAYLEQQLAFPIRSSVPPSVPLAPAASAGDQLMPATPPNPFTSTIALRDPTHFIGRQAELRRLRAMLHSGSVSLQGEPKIGKSSLLWRMADEGRETKDELVIGPLDCQALADRDDFYEHLAQALDLQDAAWRAIRSALQTRPALLLLDELDAAPACGLAHSDLARLRAACSANRALHIIVASRAPLKDVFPDTGRGSPAYNFLQPLTLGKLTAPEARLLLTHPWDPAAPPFDAPTCDQLLALAGRRPFQLQRAAFWRYESLHHDPAHDWRAAYQQDMEQML